MVRMPESDNPISLIDTPTSPSIFETYHAVTAAIEKPPNDIILQIVVNDFVKRNLPPHLTHLCSEHYLTDHFFMCVAYGDTVGNPHYNEWYGQHYDVKAEPTKKIIKTPWLGGRSIPIQWGEIPMFRFLMGTIMAKGPSGSGRYYNQTGNEIRDCHVGFISGAEIRDEIEVGNELLECGFRAAPCLGYLVLHADKLSAWLTDQWNPGSETIAEFQDTHIIEAKRKAITEAIKIISDSHDDVGYLYRVSGVTERLSDNWEGRGEKLVTDERVIKHRKGEMKRAVSLLYKEAEQFPEHFNTYVWDKPIGEIKDCLLKISNGQTLNTGNFETYVSLICGVCGENARSLQRLYEKYPKYIHSNLNGLLTVLHDIDFAFFNHDMGEIQYFDPSEFQTTGYEATQEYVRNIALHYRSYLRSQFIDLWVNEDDKGYCKESVEHMEDIVRNAWKGNTSRKNK